MPEAYWKRRLKRAFSDTLGPLGWNRQTLFVGAQATVTFLLFVWAFLGEEAMKGEVAIVAATLLALGVVFVGNFMWNYVFAPSRMQAEADARVAMLQAELDQINEKQNAVDRLSDLLSEAISSIWNCQVNSDAELNALEQTWKNWRQRVIDELEENFTHSDVIHFSRLGVIPIQDRGNTFNSYHQHILRQYALQETRLREIIRDHNITRLINGTRKIPKS